MSLFIELLQVSLGTRDCLSRVPSAEEWDGMLAEALRHAVVGIMAFGIDRLSKVQQPPKMVRVQWAGQVLNIERRNAVMTFSCRDLCRRLEEDGFHCCVLKGQANHAYYPEDMGVRRDSGDIDVWVETVNGARPVRQTVEYVQEKFGMTGLNWLHASCDVGNVPVEVHFHPSFFSRPKYNRRFQRHFADLTSCCENKRVDGTEIPAMKADEDVLYQMNHIFRHLIDEGVGLRQVIDYYMLLKVWNGQHVRSKEETMKIISYLGMTRFAGALMYVLREALGMSEELLLCKALEEDGRFLMNDILLSGNFGHEDPRMGAIAEGCYLKRRLSQASRRFKRNLRFLTSYPGEVIWEPIVRVEHFAWKKLRFWKCE